MAALAASFWLLSMAGKRSAVAGGRPVCVPSKSLGTVLEGLVIARRFA